MVVVVTTGYQFAVQNSTCENKECSVLLEKSKLSGVAASFPPGLYNFTSNPKQIRFKSMQFLLSDVTKKSS